VVGQGDKLADGVIAALQRQQIRVIRVAPQQMADQAVLIDGNTFRLQRQPIDGILLRASPEGSYSDGFVPEDRSFSDTETRSMWLAATHLDTVVAVNRYDAEAWFGSVGWVKWRQVLREQNVPVAPFRFGDAGEQSVLYQHWYPYASARAQPAPERVTRRVLGAALAKSTQAEVKLAVCGRVIDGPAAPAAAEAAGILHEHGIHLASIATDSDGQVLTIDTLPAVQKAELIDRAAELLSGFYCEHLCRR
jgi:hypothetical protein